MLRTCSIVAFAAALFCSSAAACGEVGIEASRGVAGSGVADQGEPPCVAGLDVQPGTSPAPKRDKRPDDGKPPTVDELAHDLRAPRPETRRSAVKKLSALGTREALALVVEALGDLDGQVADEAQVLLGSTTDAKIVTELAGHAGLGSQDEWIQLRAAEALGRVPVAIDARHLLRCVSGSDADLARTSLWSIERQLRSKHVVGDAKVLVKPVDAIAEGALPPEVRGAAVCALQAADAFAAHDRAIDLLTEREPALRCAALLVATAFSEQEALNLSVKALDDPAELVRTQAIENLERQKSRNAVMALIGRLEREERSRLRWEILRFLSTMSGEDHGFDLAAWRAWAAKIQGPWSTGDATPRAAPIGDTRVALAGLTLLSDRVAFLIDLSGSMWGAKVGEKTRKELVDERLRACLEALPATASFNVIPYTRDPIPWEKRLVRATPENVKRALDAFERCHQTGPGNFFDAALLALRDPDVDTIVALTDGAPTGGHRWNLELMIELLVETNRFRKVAFDSILVDAPKGNRRLWADLAARTGGRSIAIELGPTTGNAGGAGRGESGRKPADDRHPPAKPDAPARKGASEGAP